MQRRFDFTTVVAAYLAAGVAVALFARVVLVPSPAFAWLFR